MKNIYLYLIFFLINPRLFAQDKPGAGKVDDASIARKHPPQTAMEVKPVMLDVIEHIEANMVSVPGGSFTMGCSNYRDTGCYYWEKPAHKVEISSFYLCKFDVTQKEWDAVLGPNKYTVHPCPDCPVENVSWFDAQIFINRLNQLTGQNYRLPTEAEWEYAARGAYKGHPSTFAGGNNLSEVGWYSANSDHQTHPVGQKKPNELGLYDMTGNVWQWCSDWFNEKYYSKSPDTNPEGPARDSYRVVRGGSWWSDSNDCRLSNRDRYPPGARDDDVGFRIAHD